MSGSEALVPVEFVEAARALAAKAKEVADASIGVFQMEAIRGRPYSGPHYGEELERMEEAIRRLDLPDVGDPVTCCEEGSAHLRMKVNRQIEVPCPYCRDGVQHHERDSYSDALCSVCRGSGKVYKLVSFTLGSVAIKHCPFCGKRPSLVPVPIRCPHCGGTNCTRERYGWTQDEDHDFRCHTCSTGWDSVDG